MFEITKAITERVEFIMKEQTLQRKNKTVNTWI